MESLKYKIIKTELQYKAYSTQLENLLLQAESPQEDEIELLTLLIEKWESDNSSIAEQDPISLLKGLMEECSMNAIALGRVVGLSKGTVSKILSYQAGLSKNTIRKLANHFKLSQEAFNRPYALPGRNQTKRLLAES